MLQTLVLINFFIIVSRQFHGIQWVDAGESVSAIRYWAVQPSRPVEKLILPLFTYSKYTKIVFLAVRSLYQLNNAELNHTTPNQTHPYQTKLIHTKPHSSIPNRTQLHQTELIHTKPNSSIPNWTQLHQTKLIHTKPNSFIPNRTQPHQTKLIQIKLYPAFAYYLLFCSLL